MIRFIFFTIILYFLYLIGWTENTSAYIYGLYTEVDGQLAAWYGKALTVWSHPWDMSVLNPFQGMVSLFIPNSPWWNPGALALSLPFSTLTNYIISYSIYWFELYFSIYFLARAISFKKVESLIAPQVFLLFLFPMTSGFFWGISFYSLGPFNAHLIAICNLITIVYIFLGRRSLANNLVLVCCSIFLVFVLIYSAPVTILTFIPAYGLICLGLTIQGATRSSILWKLATILLLFVILWALGALDYYRYTSKYAAASLGVPSGITFSFPKNWPSYDFCNNPQLNLFCTKIRMDYFHIFAFLGGLVGLFWRSGKYRWVSLGFCIVSILPDFLTFLFTNNILGGSIIRLNPVFYLWSAYPFYSLFFVLFFSFIMEYLFKICHLLKKIKLPLNLSLDKNYFTNKANKFYSSTHLGGLFLAIVPCVVAVIWFSILSKNKTPLKPPTKTPIVEYLQKNIGLTPGDTFRGSTASYFAAESSPMRSILNGEKKSPFKPDYYIQAREYFNANYGNRFMFSDLWNYTIPTLEEYGQWVSVPMSLFFQKILAEPNDSFYRSFLNVYKLDLRVLSALGTRFVITDQRLRDSKLNFVLKETHSKAPSIFLYEIKNPNLANYSPTEVKQLNSANEIFSEISKASFSFEDSVIIQQALPKKLVKAKDSKLVFTRNAISIKAQSNGWSILLLPVQYSHCLHFSEDHNDGGSSDNIQLLRANLIQTAILFKDSVDTKIQFDFGIGNNTQCRKKDIFDIQQLGLIEK